MFAIMLVDDARKDLALLPARLRSAAERHVATWAAALGDRGRVRGTQAVYVLAGVMEGAGARELRPQRVDGRAVEVLRIVRKGRKKTEDVT